MHPTGLHEDPYATSAAQEIAKTHTHTQKEMSINSPILTTISTYIKEVSHDPVG